MGIFFAAGNGAATNGLVNSNIVRNNTITDIGKNGAYYGLSTVAGIKLADDGVTHACYNNTITGNTITDTQTVKTMTYGICEADNSRDNFIKDNTVTGAINGNVLKDID